MKNHNKALEIFSEMSDELLITLQKQPNKTVWAEDDLMRKVVRDIYGDEEIMGLYVMSIIPALLEVITERFTYYSKTILP